MIQPLDIKTQQFKKGLFGYKASDVDSFVDTVYKAYDEVYTENATLSDELEKMNKAIEESRLKIFDLENKLQKAENVSSYDDPSDIKKSNKIIEEAKRTAAEIISKAKEESDKIIKSTKGDKVEATATVEKEKPAEEKSSAASKFFKKAEETSASTSIDDDEIFVGEIEDNRKPNKMMIGDGEEEEDADFEFL